MVLRSGIILPFQFRDTKKLLMIGVPEENRDLSIWDLKNVVRAAFGIYNFEFRNKKIGFNIPDELLLHYLAQRHDLTNFVIEIGQVYEPARDKYPPIASCATCRCVAAVQKLEPLQVTTNNCLPQQQTQQQQQQQQQTHQQPLPLHIPHEQQLQPHQQIHQQTSHQTSISSIATSQNSPNVDEPPLKIRNTNSVASIVSDVSHIEVEPKIDFSTTPEANSDTEDGHPMHKSYVDDGGDSLPPHAGGQQATDMHYERLQHEFFMQQQQHQQQQQPLPHQLQPPPHHIETVLQQQQQDTTSGNNYRQRKERMSKKQKEVYVSFLERNPEINDYRRNDPVLDRHWIQLADILNSVPQGAVKHVGEWKQTFDNWRYRVFLYARFNSKVSGEDSTNPKSFKPLTHTDKRAYAIWIRNPDTAPPDLEKMRNVFVNLEETLQD